MLESVIQNHDLCVEGRDGMMPDHPAIAADEYGNARRMCSKHEGFVAGMRHIRVDMRTIGYDRDRQRAVASIPTTRKHDAPPSKMKTQRETGGEGRLSRTANREPTHAHDCTSQTAAFRRRLPHERTMRPRTDAVENRRDSKHSSRKCS